MMLGGTSLRVLLFVGLLLTLGSACTVTALCVADNGLGLSVVFGVGMGYVIHYLWGELIMQLSQNTRKHTP